MQLAARADLRCGGAIAVIAALLLVVIIPLRISSGRIDKTSVLRRDLDAAGLNGLDVRVSLGLATYQPVPRQVPAGVICEAGKLQSQEVPQRLAGGCAGGDVRERAGQPALPAVTSAPPPPAGPARHHQRRLAQGRRRGASAA